MPAWVIPAMIAGSAVMGAMGGKDRSKRTNQPTTTKFNNYSQTTPFDYDPGTEGNQGSEAIQALLENWLGLLGQGLGPSDQYQQNVSRGLGGSWG